MELSIRQLASCDVVISGIFAAQTFWPYKDVYVMNRRPSNQLFCNLRGERAYYVNGECILCIKPGDVLLMPTGSTYTTVATSEEGNEGIAVLFSLRGADNCEIILDAAPGIVAHDDHRYYAETLQKLLSYVLQGGYAILRAKELVYALLYRIAMDQSLTLGSPVQKILLPAVRYMENHLQRTLCVGELAEMCFISRSTFFRYFQSEFGMSPTAYHLKMRMEKSRELLESQMYTVEQVAEVMGFCDTAYFSRMFHRITGQYAGSFHPVRGKRRLRF